MKTAVILSAVAVLVGCAAPPTTTFPIVSATFDSAAAVKMLQPGPNTLRGSALMRQKNGGVVTCAGGQVSLIPATAYAKERILAIYGDGQRGAISLDRQVAPGAAGYVEATKRAPCDAQGFFTFKELADGEFFVTTTIRWFAGRDQQGGHLMQRVVLDGAKTMEIVLAQ